MTQPFDLSQIDPTAAQVNATVRSGAGGGKTLRFLGNVLAGLSNFRSGGLVGVGSTIADRMSQQAYIDKLEQQQRAALMAEQGMYTQAANQLGLPTYNGTFVGGKETFNTLRPAYQSAQTNKGLNDRIHGQQSDFGPLADPSIVNQQIKELQDRRALVADSAANLEAVAPWYGSGYERTPSKERVWNPIQSTIGNGISQAMGKAAANATGLKPLLEANTTFEAAQPAMQSPFRQYDLYGQDPYTIGVVNPDVALKSLGIGQSARGSVEDEKDKDAQLAETIRSNKEDEAIGWYNAKHKGGGGGSQNPYTIPNAALENINKQISATEGQLKALGFVDEKGNITRPKSEGAGLFGFGADPAKQAESLGKQRQFDALNNKRLKLYELASGGLTFGGGQAQKLEQAGAKPATNQTILSAKEWAANKGKK